MTRYVTLEGCHATGTSKHADALAESLRFLGIDAVAWHHERHPDGAIGADRVIHYAESRRPLWDASAPRHAVYVCDRGPWSGVAYAASLVAEGVSPLVAGLSAARIEIRLWWQDTPVVMLDAADATLDARLLLRGEDPAASHGERAQWRRLAAAEGWPVVATDGDRDGVTRALLTWALRVLA